MALYPLVDTDTDRLHVGCVGGDLITHFSCSYSMCGTFCLPMALTSLSIFPMQYSNPAASPSARPESESPLVMVRAPASMVVIVSTSAASSLDTSVISVFLGMLLDLHTILKWSCLPHLKHFFPYAGHSFSLLSLSELWPSLPQQLQRLCELPSPTKLTLAGLVVTPIAFLAVFPLSLASIAFTVSSSDLSSSLRMCSFISWSVRPCISLNLTTLSWYDMALLQV